MYARMTTWRLGAENRSTMERLADEAFRRVRGMDGFRSATYMADDAAGEYIGLTVWESKEAADAAGQASAEQLRRIAADLGQQPEVRTFEVYEPQA